MLYEWTRRTVADRNFYVGLSGEVPAAVCDAGLPLFAASLLSELSGVCGRRRGFSVAHRKSRVAAKHWIVRVSGG
jgi:hypothetical protein